MSKPPLKRTPRPAVNPSRAAGEPAPASAGATKAFYDPASVEERQAAASELGIHAATVEAHVAQVQEQSVDLDEHGTADAAFVSAPDSDAPPSREEIERIRSMRKPLGTLSQKLALPQRRGYHRHWFNDAAGRLNEAEANGWAFIQDKGKPLHRPVGTGRDNGVMYAYAMELPEVFWQEDMAARHQLAADTIAATKANPFKSAPGAAKPSDKGKFYSPEESPLTVEVR